MDNINYQSSAATEKKIIKMNKTNAYKQKRSRTRINANPYVTIHNGKIIDFNQKLKALNSKDDKEFIKYLSVGCINTIFGYTVFSSLMYVGLHYHYAVCISTLMSLLFNFNTIGKIVFKNKNNRLICKFMLVFAFLTFMNIMLLHIAEFHHANLYYADAVILVCLGGLSFLLNKYFVFIDGQLNMN